MSGYHNLLFLPPQPLGITHRSGRYHRLGGFLCIRDHRLTWVFPDLTPDCNILFASESINDILGWRAEDVRGRSVFDYFHPNEVPFARSIHSRGILLDKAASLHYARILSAAGQWVSCECCFTVVHDVLVACTSIYRQSLKSERRALEGAQIRRIFSSSPRDPRYHMLEHLSPKFQMPPVEREPRAALILNRFTRNLTIMFSTNAVASVLGLSPDQVKDKSFYRCIQERCLPDALKCLESAKANDSIAYLRFWSRDPREEEDFEGEDEDDEAFDGAMADGELGSNTSDSDEGGAALGNPMEVDSRENSGPVIKEEEEEETMSSLPLASGGSSAQHSSTGVSSGFSQRTPYETPRTRPSAASAAVGGQANQTPRRRRRERQQLHSVELEAVVSCTSDGLVVILRRARPPIPAAHPPLVLPPWDFENGLFAAPWAQQPVRPYVPPEMLHTFQAPLMPHFMPLRENVKATGGPPMEYMMRSIRDVAVFAWALVGINGNLASFSHGLPTGEAAPPGGLPMWDPRATDSVYQPPENQAAARWAALESSSGKEKAPNYQQQQPFDPHAPRYAPPYVPAGQHNSPYGVDNYTHGAASYNHQPSSYPYSGHESLPPPYQLQAQTTFSGTSNRDPLPNPWSGEQRQRSPPGSSQGPYTAPTSQLPGRPDSPREHDRQRP